MRRQCGMTLVEVLVAVTILVVMAAMVWLAQPLRARWELRAAALELVGDLRAAQSRAIGEREPDRAHGIEFPPGGDRYVLVARSGQTRTPLRVHSLPASVRITYAQFGGTEPSTIWYTGVSLLGAPSGGGTVTLSSGGARLCVRVLPTTGRIRVTDIGCP